MRCISSESMSVGTFPRTPVQELTRSSFDDDQIGWSAPSNRRWRDSIARRIRGVNPTT